MELVIDTSALMAVIVAEPERYGAYDAYFLDCAIRHKAPLLTLDKKLRIIAENLNIETLEVLNAGIFLFRSQAKIGNSLEAG